MTADRLPPRVLIIIAQLGIFSVPFAESSGELPRFSSDMKAECNVRYDERDTLIIRYADYWRVRET